MIAHVAAPERAHSPSALVEGSSVVRASGFRSVAARDAYCRLYDDAARPPLIALYGKAFSPTMWLPPLPTLAAAHRVYLLAAFLQPADGKDSAPADQGDPR
jgi:hypothetical protein